MEMIKRYTIYGPGDIRQEWVEKPVAGPDDVVVRVAFSGICATDLDILGGDMGLIRDGSIRYPVRFGHEWSGVVESVGDAVTQFVPGDRVVSDPGVTCGQCEACLSGDMHGCKQIRSVGTVNCWDGSFSEYMIFPQRHLHKVPEGVSLKQASLVEPATIALAGVRKVNIQPGMTVMVVGTGAIGMAAVALSKAMGASRVLLCGRTPYKLDIGRKLGADVTINTTRQDMVRVAQEETGGCGVDAIIETSGNTSVLNDCLHSSGNGAVIALIGFYEEKTIFDIDHIVSRSLQVCGVMGDFGLSKPVMKLMAEGKLDLSALVTHQYCFDETIDVMKNARVDREMKIKMLIQIAEA